MQNPAHGEEQLHKTVHAKLHWLENSLENSLDLDDTKLTMNQWCILMANKAILH